MPLYLTRATDPGAKLKEMLDAIEQHMSEHHFRTERRARVLRLNPKPNEAEMLRGWSGGFYRIDRFNRRVLRGLVTQSELRARIGSKLWRERGRAAWAAIVKKVGVKDGRRRYLRMLDAEHLVRLISPPNYVSGTRCDRLIVDDLN